MYKNAVKVWINGEIQESLNNFYPKFTFNSNRIENDETRLIDVQSVFKGEKTVGFKGNGRTIREIKNHKIVCGNMLDTINKNKSKLSIDLIKQLHYNLANGCLLEKLLSNGERPGKFKREHYVVGPYSIGSKPSEVEDSLRFIIDEVNNIEINEDNALKVISYFHCYFEAIHPFCDFNGRVGRLLINYILIANKLPPIIIFESDRKEYYLALEYFNETQEIDKMVDFLDFEAYKTWN